MAGGYLATIAK